MTTPSANRVASMWLRAYVQPAIDIANTPHGLESALVDKQTGTLIALVEAKEIEPPGYWVVQAGRVFDPFRGEGYGTEAYVAAIKYATETGGGLIQTDEASRYALKVRDRVRQRGFKVQPCWVWVNEKGKETFGFNPPSEAPRLRSGVLMTGKRRPAYPNL